MPTVLRIGPYRFFFWSNENDEPCHIHVKAAGNEAKFWLRPVDFAANYGFSGHELNDIENLVIVHEQELVEAWDDYFDEG